MELIELAVTNFKKFTDGRFRFCPGLNLLWGPNESGKSTLHEAISCVLFGRERNKEIANWNGGSCAVGLTYRSDGKLYRIERQLTEGTYKLGDPAEGEQTKAITDKNEIEQMLAAHLGISSRSVFDNTISIRQMNVSSAEASDMENVVSEIQRVLTGTANISASEVLIRLEAKRNDIKGKARPTNLREYDGITDHLHKLAEELADARRSREQIGNLEEELIELQARSDRDSERLSVLGALLERHKRWSELKKRESESNNLHENVFSSVKHLKETLSALTTVQKELEGYADLVGKDDEIAEHLSKIDSRGGELAARLAEFEAVGEDRQSARPGIKAGAFLTAAIVFAVAGLAAGFIFDRRNFLLLIPAIVFAFIYVAKIIGRGTGFKHIAEMRDSAQNELKQLEDEESSILSYIKCQNVGKAWKRIKTYRNLATQARELEVTLKALLGKRKLADWESQEAELDRELSGIRRELGDEFSDYSPTTEEAETWRSEHAALQSSLPIAQARLHEVRGSLETERRNARDLAALEGEIEFLHRRRDELEFIYKAYDEAIAALTAVTQTFSDEYLPALCEQSAGYLEKLTSGRYTSVSVKPGWEISVDCRDRSGVQPSTLSIGTLDQLYFALRIACGELLSAGRKLPIILDDPFANFDRRRLDNVLKLLAKLAAENQILLLTHDPYTLDWARKLASSNSVSCVVHDLPGPMEEA